MITDLEKEAARGLIARTITRYNSLLSRTEKNFPKEKIEVPETSVKLEPILNRELLEFTYSGWHCYVSHDHPRMVRMADHLKAERMHIEYVGMIGGLAYLISNEKHTVHKK